jgi:hypothetical protein
MGKPYLAKASEAVASAHEPIKPKVYSICIAQLSTFFYYGCSCVKEYRLFYWCGWDRE